MIGGYSQRQTIALERPNYLDARVGGFIATDPHTKRVQAVADPNEGIIAIGTADRARAKNKHYQFGTILTVDMEDWPMWHAHCSFLDTVDDYLVPRAQWRDWMERKAAQEMRNLLPGWCRESDAPVRVDRQKYSFHVRCRVSQLERDYLEVVRQGGIDASIAIRDPQSLQ